MARRTDAPTGASSDVVPTEVTPAPAAIRCIRPVRVPRGPGWRHSRQINDRDVFSGEVAAWLWTTYGPEYFEPYTPKRR